MPSKSRAKKQTPFRLSLAVLFSKVMPNEHIISLLIAERDKLNRAIETLQGSAKRRGRPPKNQSASGAVAAAAPKRKRRTAAQRKAQAERMKAYWAAKRKKEAKR
jgi:hypothetical protein